LQKSINSLVVILGVVLLGSAASMGGTITDNAHGFTLVVPGRFATQLPASGDMLYNFATSDPKAGVPDAIVSIQRMRRLIGPSASKMSTGQMSEFLRGMMAGASEKGLTIMNPTFSTIKWRDYTLQLSSAQLDINGVAFTSRVVQVPLLNGAVQIIVVSPLDKSAEADAAMAEFVDGMSGTSNWDPPTDAEFTSDAVMTGIPALLLGWLLIAPRKKLPAPANAVRRKRHRRSAWACVITTVVILGICIVLAVIALKRGNSVYGPERQGYMMVSGGVRLSLWCGILAYGITRLILRLSGGKANVPFPATAEPGAGPVPYRW
jgi:hypothetical protein